METDPREPTGDLGYDMAHEDMAHGDTVHGDTAHGDTAHGDTAHGDTAHGDTAREATGGRDDAAGDFGYDEAHDFRR